MRLRTIPFIGGAGYGEKVRNTENANLIGYWRMNEAAGGVSDNYEGTAARDGAYVGVTLGQTGIGDGLTCPLFDGANDYNNIFTASFRDAFNGAEGSAMIWIKMSAAGVWTDGVLRHMMTIQVDANNNVLLTKGTVNNQVRLVYEANGAVEAVTDISLAGSTAWHQIGLTWSKSSGGTGEVKGYIDGAQVSTTKETLGVWAGVPFTTTTVVGAKTTAPANVWDGYLAHAAVWTTPLLATQMLELATV